MSCSVSLERHVMFSEPRASCHVLIWGPAKAFYSSRPGVGEWSPEGLHDKTVSWIPNTDEILKLLKKKID